MSVPKRIGKIRFGLISPQEFRKMSVVKIITADTYDDDGFPIEMGLMDPRLGVIDPGLRCRTCGGRPGECPGHFGHIDLIAPVIHVGFAKLIRKVLRAVCRDCSRLMLKDAEMKMYLEQIQTLERLGQMTDDTVNKVFAEARKNKTCPYCGAPQQEIKFERPLSYIEDGHKLTPSDIRDRFEKIPDEDILVMGMNPATARPEWMILTVLPVPPVTMRPSITLESGQRSEDDLTHKLVDIIRINQRFQENREAGAPQLIIEDLWELLQYHVTTFLDNTVSGVPPARHRSGRPLKTLSQRLKGKEGRFRGSLSGKRVNFSARTVISPDPNLSIGEVGVPLEVAMELSVPMIVNARNKEMARTYVRRGPDHHPGVNYVTRPDQRRVKVTGKNCEEVAEQIDIGWRIDRQLADGDIVLFNRQPSLHRMSIMSHRVRVMPYKTFRLNPAVCPPYNADFDGDEMNMHVPQTEEARAEAEILMRVQENILSPRFGGPIIGGIHDYVTGSFLLTHGNKPIHRQDVMELLKKFDIAELPEPEGEVDGQPYWTGKQIFSLILPRGLNLTFKADFCYNCDVCRGPDCENDAYVVIKDGKLLKGTIDAEAVGAFKGKITDRIIKEYSPSVASEFLDRMTRLALRGIMHAGFSFGIDDEDIPQEATEQIEETTRTAREKSQQLIEAYRAGELEPLPGRTLDETLEMRIMQTLGKARDTAGKIASRYLGLDNSGVVMAVSGARGSMLNLTQMAACVGQQSVRGERIMRGYAGRTLPHFQRGDLGAEAHGFVESSYKDGLNPTEFFFHAIGGREGLVDTAIRTSQSGYLQRRLVNALQDLEVKYDGTVKETRGMIVQFRYGEDGVDASRRDYASTENVKRIIKNVLKKESA
ncbi:MAG TPA: DNA-directed RNA polymerase subunit A' [Methanothrix sp.]|nr:DNA-directed RNA polymerase subunit A' [Methanothrix sp.]HPC89310.1 DNA-directed RNA polymerase subunit A' [Methanothrix sp.]HQE87317.1 DNA-directed RNA polymerase subunit A' [Methanothrix sp.]HQI67676.1 DNA-directed RNA polymerase subunit A' [Methanothrix sp.]HRS85185.1 DNA-directed RNA polymerase subunit A' [Methanothrix sp.]